MIVGLVTVEPAAPQHELSPPFTGIGTWNGLAAPRPQASVQGSELEPNSRRNRPALPPTSRSHSVLLVQPTPRELIPCASPESNPALL
jgi:hypothetical protein